MGMTPEHLVTEVISELRKVGYSESTLDAFRVLYKHLLRFMEERNLSNYTHEVGKEALPIMCSARNCEKNRRQCGVVIRHLDNFIVLF